MTTRLSLPTESDIKAVLRPDRGNLPSFPQAAAKLLETSRDGTTSLKDISKIIETDPGLSAQVLKMVNSAMYGLGRDITTLSDAVVLLGLDEIKKQAIGLTLFKEMIHTGEDTHIDRLLFWRHSLAVAVLGREIARKTGYVNPEEAYIAGLLHDLGKIFLDLQGEADYGEFIRTISTTTDIVIESERRQIGLGHDDIGAYFCAQWQLPDKLVAAVKYHHQSFAHADLPDGDKALIAVVALADFICWTQGIGSFDFILPPVLAPEVEEAIDLDRVDIIDCINRMNTEISDISAFYKFVFPSDSRLKENLLWANLKLSRINTRYYYEDSPLTRVHEPPVNTDVPLLLESEFSKPLARAKSVKEVLDIVMYQIGRIFEPAHWSLLLKDPKSGNLVFSVVVGENKKKLLGAKLRKGEGIAGYIMETGESLIVDDVSKDERFSSRVDNYTGFRTRSIIGTPLKTGNKTFGVIQLINKAIDGSFTEKDMGLLADIAEYAAIAIERSYYTQALKNLATKDAVTGLKNRWSFERALSNKTEFIMKHGSIFSMLIIRIDGLDRMGPDQDQDDALKNLAAITTRTKRRDDSLYRYGESIFLMLLPLTYSDGAQKMQHRIKAAVSEAAAGQKLPFLSLDIVHHTLSSDEAGALKSRIKQVLSGYKRPVSDDSIADFEENLQPLVEQEKAQAVEETGKKQGFGKTVSLGGHYIHTKTRKSVPIRVRHVTLEAIGFTIPKNQAVKTGDFLVIQFVLDDLKRSVVKRQVIVGEIEDDYVRADFYNPPPFAKNLGFYLIN